MSFYERKTNDDLIYLFEPFGKLESLTGVLGRI